MTSDLQEFRIIPQKVFGDPKLNVQPHPLLAELGNLFPLNSQSLQHLISLVIAARVVDFDWVLFS